MAFIVAGGPKGIIAYCDAFPSKKHSLIETDYDVSRIACFNGSIIAMGSDLHIYDRYRMVSTGRISAHGMGITSYFTAGSLLYTTGEDGMVFGWDLRIRQPAKTIRIGKPLSSGILYRDEIYLADYTGGLHKANSPVGKGTSDCAVYLEKYEKDLIGYSSKGKLYKVHANSSTPYENTGVAVGSGYGIRCRSKKNILALSSSGGIGFIEKRDDMFKLFGFIEASGWIWDIEFTQDGKNAFYVSSNGTLGKASFYREQKEETEQDKVPAMHLDYSTVFSVDYPLKAIGIDSESTV